MSSGGGWEVWHGPGAPRKPVGRGDVSMWGDRQKIEA